MEGKNEKNHVAALLCAGLVIGELEREKDEKMLLGRSTKQLFLMDLYKYMCTGKQAEGLKERCSEIPFIKSGYLLLYIHKDYSDFGKYLHTSSIEMFKEHFVEAALGEVFKSDKGMERLFKHSNPPAAHGLCSWALKNTASTILDAVLEIVAHFQEIS